MAGTVVWDNQTAGDTVTICEVFDGDVAKCDAIAIVRWVVNSLSIVGCLFVLFVIILFRRYHAFCQRLVIYLSVSSLLGSIVDLTQTGRTSVEGPFCTAVGFITNVTSWWILLWVWAITFNLFMLVIKNKKTEKYEWVYLAVCILVPVFISSLPFAENKYGPAGVWCWIENDWRWRFGILYIPLVVSVTGLCIVYMYIRLKLSKQLKVWEGHFDPDTEARKVMLKDEIAPLQGYPIVYLVISVFPFIHRLQNIFSEEAVFALILLHSLTDPMLGGANAIVFCMDKHILENLKPKQFKLALDQWWYKKKVLIQEYPEGEPSDAMECSHSPTDTLPPDIGTDMVQAEKKMADNSGSPLSGEIL